MCVLRTTAYSALSFDQTSTFISYIPFYIGMNYLLSGLIGGINQFIVYSLLFIVVLSGNSYQFHTSRYLLKWRKQLPAAHKEP
jgi:hypothetical protein